MKAAYLSTVFSTVVEERNLIYLAPLVFIRAGARARAAAAEPWAVAASAGLVLYVILTTPYQLDLWPYADALGFGIVQMANRDLAFDNGDVKLLLVVVLVISLGAPARARDSCAVARRPWAPSGSRVVAAALVLAWNVTGEVSASNGVNMFSQNLPGELPDPADLDRRRDRRQADDLPRPARSPTRRGSG